MRDTIEDYDQLTKWVQYRQDIEFAIEQLGDKHYRVFRNYDKKTNKKYDEFMPMDWIAVFILKS